MRPDSIGGRQAAIIERLMSENGYMTAQKLAAGIGVSVRTIKSDIAALNLILPKYRTFIESSPRKGYIIRPDVDISVLKALPCFPNESEMGLFHATPQSGYDRTCYLLRKLIVVDYPLAPEDLADDLFVSLSTLLRDLKKVKELLSRFDLLLETRKKGGIFVIGLEIDKRRCISEYFFHNTLSDGYRTEGNLFKKGLNRQEYEGIRDILRLVCKEYKIVLSDVALNNLVIHVFISLVRYRFYCFVTPGTWAQGDLQSSAEYRAAQKLTQILQEVYGFTIPEGETLYYALHLRVKRIYDEIPLQEKEQETIKICIKEIFNAINNTFGLDFSPDMDLYNYLYQHIPLMIVRLGSRMSLRYPKLTELPASYIFAAKVTHVAVEVIEKIYSISINQRELEYLIIYFCYAMDKFHLDGDKPVSIGIYNGGGRAETILYYSEIKKEYGLRHCDVHLLRFQPPYQEMDCQ